MKADEEQPQTGRVVSALCADMFEPQARRYNRIPHFALATGGRVAPARRTEGKSFPEFILGWTTRANGV